MRRARWGSRESPRSSVHFFRLSECLFWHSACGLVAAAYAAAYAADAADAADADAADAARTKADASVLALLQRLIDMRDEA